MCNNKINKNIYKQYYTYYNIFENHLFKRTFFKIDLKD